MSDGPGHPFRPGTIVAQLWPGSRTSAAPEKHEVGALHPGGEFSLKGQDAYTWQATLADGVWTAARTRRDFAPAHPILMVWGPEHDKTIARCARFSRWVEIIRALPQSGPIEVTDELIRQGEALLAASRAARK